MIQFVSRMRMGLVIIAIALMAILSFTVLSGGVAHTSSYVHNNAVHISDDPPPA